MLAISSSSNRTVSTALEAMRHIGVRRRLPVVGNRGELVGILSIDDILDMLAGDLQHVAAPSATSSGSSAPCDGARARPLGIDYQLIGHRLDFGVGSHLNLLSRSLRSRVSNEYALVRATTIRIRA
jgi:hypothetical protein